MLQQLKTTKIQDIDKTYCYTIGAKDQKINLKDYLPSDISNATYEAKITNLSGNLVSEAAKTDTSYIYNVSKAGKAGDQSKIQFTVKSDNYEDMTFNVNITLTDKLSIAPKEGEEPAIEGNNELTYGQKISDLKLNTTKNKILQQKMEVKLLVNWNLQIQIGFQRQEQNQQNILLYQTKIK